MGRARKVEVEGGRGRRVVIGALVVAAGIPGGVAASAGPSRWIGPAPDTLGRYGQRFAPCTLEGYDGEAFCGRVAVPEDPVAPGRVLSLRVAILPATGPDSLRRPDPVLILDGGPGQAASRAAPWVAEDLEVVRRGRDVILSDRRGTGGSNALDCPDEPGPETPPGEVVRPAMPGDVRRCREHLEARADLTKYTTPFAAADVIALADSLGIERLNLYGGSYGSREAFEVVRRHPERVRSVAVFAVTPPHRRALLESPRSADRAMRRLIDDCMVDDACRRAYPDLRRELDEVVRRLEEEPATFTVPLPDGGHSDPLRLTRTGFGSVLRTGLLSPAQSASIPALIHAAYGGDFDALGAAYVRIARLTPAALSRGLFLSAACAEELGRVRAGEIGPATAGTFWGDGWVRSLRDQCAEWPRGDLPPDFFDPPTGDTPMLLLSGWLDPIAPPAWAEELHRHMPNARRVVVREGHHNFAYDACARGALARFFDELDPFGMDVRCIAEAPRPPFLVPAAGGGAG